MNIPDGRIAFPRLMAESNEVVVYKYLFANPYNSGKGK